MVSSGEHLSIEQCLKSDSKLPLLLPTDLEGQTLEIFLKSLSALSGSDDFIRLYALFGREIFLLLSLFQSETLRFPSYTVLERLKSYSQIYTFLSQRDFSDAAYDMCARVHSRRRKHLESIVSRVRGYVEKVEGYEH